MSKNYVPCDKCYKEGVKDKVDTEDESIWLKLAGFVYKTFPNKYSKVMYTFLSGVNYNIPMCCNLSFCKKEYNGISAIALVSEIEREGRIITKHWTTSCLSRLDKEYLKSKNIDIKNL